MATKMKTNSWHHKLNTFADEYFYRHDYRDFCSYFWITMASLFKIATLSMIAFLVSYIFSCFIIFQWKAVLTCVAFFAICILIFGYANQHTKKQPKYKEPGFIKLSYRKFRDKTCHKIEWE